MAGSVREVRVVVKAGARRERLQEGEKGGLAIEVKEPAQDGRANDRVRELIAERYGVPLKSVRIVAGHTRARKRLEVELPAPLEAP